MHLEINKFNEILKESNEYPADAGKTEHCCHTFNGVINILYPMDGTGKNITIFD